MRLSRSRRGSCLDRADRRRASTCGARRFHERYRAFAESERLLTIRGLFRIKSAEEDGRAKVPLEEVEPAKNIVPGLQLAR